MRIGERKGDEMHIGESSIMLSEICSWVEGAEIMPPVAGVEGAEILQPMGEVERAEIMPPSAGVEGAEIVPPLTGVEGAEIMPPLAGVEGAVSGGGSATRKIFPAGLVTKYRMVCTVSRCTTAKDATCNTCNSPSLFGFWCNIFLLPHSFSFLLVSTCN